MGSLRCVSQDGPLKGREIGLSEQRKHRSWTAKQKATSCVATSSSTGCYNHSSESSRTIVTLVSPLPGPFPTSQMQSAFVGGVRLTPSSTTRTGRSPERRASARATAQQKRHERSSSPELSSRTKAGCRADDPSAYRVGPRRSGNAAVSRASEHADPLRASAVELPLRPLIAQHLLGICEAESAAEGFSAHRTLLEERPQRRSFHERPGTELPGG